MGWLSSAGGCRASASGARRGCDCICPSPSPLARHEIERADEAEQHPRIEQSASQPRASRGRRSMKKQRVSDFVSQEPMRTWANPKLGRHRRETQRLANVLDFQVRKLGADLLAAHPIGYKVDAVGSGDPQAAQRGAPGKNVRIKRDSIEHDHGSFQHRVSVQPPSGTSYPNDRSTGAGRARSTDHRAGRPPLRFQKPAREAPAPQRRFPIPRPLSRPRSCGDGPRALLQASRRPPP